MKIVDVCEFYSPLGGGVKTYIRAKFAAGARWVLLLGDRELAVGEVTVRDMESGDQESVPLAAVAGVLAQRLAWG